MNPFTRFLRQWNRDKGLDELIEHCDALEALVIRVYRQGEATAADEAEYQALRRWMQARYASWQKALRPHWQATKVAGETALHDPFEAIFKPEHASSFAGDWAVMQQLSAAREALNRLVLERTTDNGT